MFETIAALGHEQVVLCSDRGAAYRAVIALHSTRRGPAVGGTRLLAYPSDDLALLDALRLSRAMSYKSALAGLPFGGGKAVILRPGGPFDRAELLRAHGRAVESLGGRFVTAEDVGVSAADLEHVRLETRHVAGLPSGAGDPAPFTAKGVLRALEAAAAWRWGTSSLAGRRIALQGCGAVGAQLARALHALGARLIVADPDATRLAAVTAETGAEAVAPDEIRGVPADVFAPCALGGVLDDAGVAALRATLVVGAANNQLLEPRHADELARRDILYVPDYVANAGGVLSGAMDLLGLARDEVERRIDAIGETVTRVLERARAQSVTPAEAADRLAEERLAQA